MSDVFYEYRPNHLSPLKLSDRAPQLATSEGILRLRWLLLTIIPLGYILTSFWQYNADYTYLTVASIACLTILLLTLGQPISETLPTWLMLFIYLVGYFVQFYWFEAVLESNAEWFFDPILLPVASNTTLMARAFSIFNLSFCVFALVASFALRLHHRGTRVGKQFLISPDSKAQIPNTLVNLLLIFLPLGMIATGYLQLHFGFGIAGADAVALPFRLSGWIFNARQILLPYLAVLCIWAAQVQQRPRAVRLGWSILIVHGLSQMLLMSSRGVLVNTLIPGFSLLFLSQGIGRKVIVGMTAAFLFTAALHPIISEYRTQRLSHPDRPVGSLLIQAMQPTLLDESGGESASIKAGAIAVVTRVMGTGSLLYAVRWGDVPFDLSRAIDLLTGRRGEFLTRWYTQVVMGFGYNVVNHLAAPGFVGSFYLLGGVWGVVIGSAGWIALWQALWSWLGKSRLPTRIVALSNVALYVLLIASEGTLDGLPLSMTMVAASIVAGELLCRFLGYGANK